MYKIFYSTLLLMVFSFSCQATKVNPVGAGSLMSQAEAQSKCPKICKDVGQNWNGKWKTIHVSTMSVCECENADLADLKPDVPAKPESK